MNPTKSSRIAVTGIGCVTALGGSLQETWRALIAGKSARGPITAIPVDGCRVTEGAQAVLSDLPRVTPKQLSRYSRTSRLALPAAREALAQAGLLSAQGLCTRSRLELSVSTTAGGMEMGELFLKNVWANIRHGQTARVARYQAQQQIAEMQRYFEFDGAATIIANACAGGGNAIGHAKDLLQTQCSDIILAGGFESLSELVFTGFDSLQSLSPDVCRPFDIHRNGLMLGEGAAFLVMESVKHARARSAEILGFVSGYGATTDLGHLTQPAQDGAPLRQAIEQALADAALDPAMVGYVNAHGTATPLNDGAEAAALMSIFGTHNTKVSSTKAAMGHTLGAAGAIEAAICLGALKEGQLPPQINLLNPEPVIAPALATPNTRAQLHATMSVNLGFGGSNTALLFERI